MTDEGRLDELTQLGRGVSEPVGRFRYVLPTRQWTWSEETYALLGLDPETTEPSTGLLLAHYHPEDLGPESAIDETALERGEPFSSYHRFVAADGTVRHALVVGEGRLDRLGRVMAVDGFVIDVTDSRRADAEVEVEAAVRGVIEHRAEIEQAKGVVMTRYRVDAEAAFEILRWTSSRLNRKLRDVAVEVVDGARTGSLGVILGLWDGHATDDLREDPRRPPADAAGPRSA